ncbi:Heat-labile enterotoxin IIA, B chain [Escherichia coli]|uniref:hypothetical protein n=1 Tax=Escherichia coli TaxID=562 RepID=UPI000942E18B|nr:hypothetical protein [Escherichia coli]EFL5807212.1 Heat-labile enterotoxin IIA, B chain [Escherichia coli]EII1486945.1 Heat-labile enterotoxin IIA, B chain [Escherichia coli]EIP6805640.1 Heat-labile enterotoxin IIA, B chain [Escherichia coli]TJP81131.1 Heat-labile enterotoxin IIA, B chain [Escherichia coli]HCB8012559.1 Heat-labile enterotoxin IIA, B chain [Escherichia coli]
MKLSYISKAYFLFLCVMPSLAYAGPSKSFIDACNATTGKLWSEEYLIKYSADTNTEHNGIYVVSESGGVWRIPGAQYYPDNHIVNEAYKTALIAVMTSMPVSLCATESTTPNEIWSIEIRNK